MKALLPAAGIRTRWYPWSKVVPKELLPLGQYPAIHYVLEEAVAAGIREIGIIISEAKKLIKAYVENVWMVNYQDQGIRIKWFCQPSPRGVGDALLCASKWINEEPTACLYPDIIHPKEGGISKLCKAFQDVFACWIGLSSKKDKQRQVSFAIEKIGENFFHILGPYSKECALRVGYGTGRSILPHGFSHMRETYFHTGNQNSEEFDDDRIFAPLWNQHDVRGITLPEPIYDIGSPQNWRFAISKLGFNLMSEVTR